MRKIVLGFDHSNTWSLTHKNVVAYDLAGAILSKQATIP
jgi:hypothetical protein